MLEKPDTNWEDIPEKERYRVHIRSERLRVPGGWVVRSVAGSMERTNVQQTFVADAAHTWELRPE